MKIFYRIGTMRKMLLAAMAGLFFGATGVYADSLCFEEAGLEYSINPKILRAIAKVESNYDPRAINWNTNGSYDFGIMQINSIWAPVLGKERWNSLGDPCTNIRTGASILAGCMKKYGYTWEAIGCYNSQTPDKRDKYAQVVFKQLQRIEREDKKLKDNMEAVVRDRVDEWVAATQTGRRQFAVKIPTSPSLPTKTLQETPAPDQSASVDEGRPAELTASSLFEGATN